MMHDLNLNSSNEPINFELLEHLASKSHPLLNIADDFEQQIREMPIAWVGEVFTQARTAHHLLDMVHVPRGEAYKSDLDSRTYIAVRCIYELGECLGRIMAWHTPVRSPGGITHDDCSECGMHWPCSTYRMASGNYDNTANDNTTNDNNNNDDSGDSGDINEI